MISRFSTLTDATTAPRLLQMEQLHHRNFSNPSGIIKFNSTAPQWQVETTL